MTNPEINAELVRMLNDARLSARLQLLEMLETKLSNLNAGTATREQILSALKAWVSVRRNVNEQQEKGDVK
ncbi:MAG: hypothetical protein WAU54_03920 [Chania sp.]